MFYYLALAYLVIPLFIGLGILQGSRIELLWFIIPAIILYILSLLLTLSTEVPVEFLTLYQKALICCGCWIISSFIMMIPFLAYLSPLDAFFESTSGLTTTGATILTTSLFRDLPFSLLVYRSWIDWIGGLGFVYSFGFFMKEDISIGIGLQQPSVEGILPGVRVMTDSYLKVYIYLSLLMLGLLMLAQTSFVNAFSIVSGVMSTGGHLPWVDSLTGFSYVQNSISIVFMILSVTTFYLYIVAYNIARTTPEKSIFQRIVLFIRTFTDSKDFQWMLGYYALFIVIILTIIILMQGPQTFNAIFGIILTCVSSFATCGVSMNGTEWPYAALLLFFLGQLFAGMTFSTSGGIKIERIRIFLSYVYARVFASSRGVASPTVAVRLSDKFVVYQNSLSDAVIVIALFLGSLFVGLFVMELSAQGDPFQFLGGLIECITNTGVGTGLFALTFAYCTIVQKVVLILAMLIGRIEIFPYMICLVGALRWARGIVNI